MNQNPVIHMKGWLRLSVVLYAVIWLAFSVYLIELNANNLSLIQRNFTPYLSYPSVPSEDDWAVYTATQKFLSHSNPERLIIAEEFFQQQKELAEALYFDIEELRRWYLKTATMAVSEAPIERYHDMTSGRDVSYRNFPSQPSFWISKIFFSPATLRTSFLITLALITIILLIFLPLRWVIRGFKTPPKF